MHRILTGKTRVHVYATGLLVLTQYYSNQCLLQVKIKKKILKKTNKQTTQQTNKQTNNDEKKRWVWAFLSSRPLDCTYNHDNLQNISDKKCNWEIPEFNTFVTDWTWNNDNFHNRKMPNLLLNTIIISILCHTLPQSLTNCFLNHNNYLTTVPWSLSLFFLAVWHVHKKKV